MKRKNKMEKKLEKEVLPICSVCKKIRIAEDMWLDKKVYPDIYQQFTERYKGKLPHSFCPSCKKDMLSQNSLST